MKALEKGTKIKYKGKATVVESVVYKTVKKNIIVESVVLREEDDDEELTTVPYDEYAELEDVKTIVDEEENEEKNELIKQAYAGYIGDGMSDEEAIAQCITDGYTNEEVIAAIADDTNEEDEEDEEELDADGNPIIKEDGNFGIPAAGASTAVKRLPNIREFLTERKNDRAIRAIIVEGAIYKSKGIIRNVSLKESEGDVPNGMEGTRKDDNTGTPKADTASTQVDPDLKAGNPIDISTGDDMKIVNVDPQNKKVIATFGDKEIILSTDYFAKDGNKEAVLERVNEEEGDDTVFGKQIESINKWFETDGGYAAADKFEWDGKVLTITKEDGSTETKTLEEITAAITDFPV